MKNRTKMKDECGEEKKSKRELIKMKKLKDNGYKFAKNLVKSSGKRTSVGYRKA